MIIRRRTVRPDAAFPLLEPRIAVTTRLVAGHSPWHRGSIWMPSLVDSSVPSLAIPKLLKSVILSPISAPTPWTFDAERTQPLA